MKLPISMEHPLMSVLHHAYPYAILSAYEDAQAWISENYIHISVLEPQQVNQASVYMGYADGYTYINEGRANAILTSNAADTFLLSKHDILDLLIYNIGHSNYVVLFVDEFYLPSCRFYQTNHYLHEQLLYGYDNEKNILYGLGINNAGVFSELSHEYKDMAEAYHKGLLCKIHGKIEWAEQNRLICMKPSEKLDQFKYLSEVYESKISQYLSGTLSERDRFYSPIFAPGTLHTGLSYTHYVFSHIWDKDFGLFRHIHHLHEHKGLMERALCYWEKNKLIESNKLSAKYKDEVCNPMSIVRNYLLKQMQIQSNHDEQTLITVKNRLESVLESEVAILSDVCG